MKPEQRTPSSDPADSYRLEHQVGYWLRRAYQRHMAIFAGIMSDLDLTSMQFAALVKLHELKAVSQTELGRLTGMDRATISGVVARLKRRNLVLYKPDPLDKRSRIIALTPAGETLLHEAMERIGRVTEQTLEPIGAADRDSLREILQKMG
ncbi:MAG: MarR family transcriptional regulator [Rhodospirillum sp.]|jgi:MarR family transcriptional regulator, lower aerobic nicotinate degradation pathway regulator|nr:MarR family transcriptional regulator [Rhodospirillum sp.]